MRHRQRSRAAFTAAGAIIAAACGGGAGNPAQEPAAAAPAPLLLAGFEPGEPPVVGGEGRVVAENATHGTHALRLEARPDGYVTARIEDRETLRRFAAYPLLQVDVVNPQDRPVVFHVRLDDGQSRDYGSRFNKDDCVAPPGRSTLAIDLTGLTCSNARNFGERRKLAVDDLRLFSLFLGPQADPAVLFLDNLRLAPGGLPPPAWLRAFDCGPAKSAVYPGFESAGETTPFSAARGWGWVGAVWTYTCWIPDALTRDCAAADAFRVCLPNGLYEVATGLGPFGMWAAYPGWLRRTLTVNGREVLDERRTAREQMEKYLAHEDDEDLPGQDLWEKFIAPHQQVVLTTAEVADGILEVRAASDTNWGRALTFVVVYPAGRRDEGRAWLAALERERRASFAARIVVTVPPPVGDEPRADARDTARGYIPFVRHTELDIPCNARPAAAERTAALRLAAARGRRADAQIGLYPLVANQQTLALAVSPLRGDGGAVIPASAARLRTVRHFLKRQGSSWMAEVKPFILQDRPTTDLRPGVTRGLWLTIRVPADAPPGRYTGSVAIGAGEHETRMPLELTVHPFALDPVTDITISVTGTRSWGSDEESWWRTADIVMRNLADHGMNAVTGGAGAGADLRAVEDGRPVIDYTRMDRWLALAAGHGLTMAGDAYQGLDVAGVPNDHGKNAVARNEALAREKFGVSYAELIALVYGDVARHAREKGWPPRVYSFLDEPRPEYGNIEACGELIRIRTAASPGTLFAGYYSTGDGRDVYFETMPVSITHVTRHALQLAARAGRQVWEYAGGGARHDIGRWCFAASRQGLRGYLRNGYGYVCSDPYFDFSDDEASWTMVFPSRDGISDTVGWERTAQGVDDYRYLATCDRLVRKARAEGRAAREAEAAARHLAETLAPVEIDRRETARLPPDACDAFREALAGHIDALGRALGEW
jgi:hypothetical protein